MAVRWVERLVVGLADDRGGPRRGRSQCPVDDPLDLAGVDAPDAPEFDEPPLDDPEFDDPPLDDPDPAPVLDEPDPLLDDPDPLLDDPESDPPELEPLPDDSLLDEPELPDEPVPPVPELALVDFDEPRLSVL